MIILQVVKDKKLIKKSFIRIKHKIVIDVHISNIIL